ncbi:MAG: PocR ligand-binding domain-containing protein [Actinobacteria bacterium]|nr:PocR ligand-binding domain-containing protein [Actinomycetota bacterium]
MSVQTQRLLEELAERLFVSRSSPIWPALEQLKDGAALKVCAPGGCAVGRKQDGEVVLVDPASTRPLLELRFEDVGDLEAFGRVKDAGEFGRLFLSLAGTGRMKVQVLGPFMELWAMGVGQFLMKTGILAPPAEYRELMEPLRLREIAFTEILDVAYLQELVDELALILGVRLWVLDMDCMPVVVSTTGGEHCKLIIDSLGGVMRCYDSAIGGMAELRRTMAPRVRICHAGFLCFDAPLILGDEMVGMISGDASLAEAPDTERYRGLAEELGLDPAPLLASLDKVRKVNIEEVEFLLSVINAIAKAVAEMSYKQYVNTRLNRELEQKNLELRALFQSITGIQEKEKAAIARDLHDDTGQDLTSALVNLEMALGEEGMPESTRRHLRSAADAISKVLEKLHDLSASLHPPVLDDLGLLEALRNLVRRLNASHPTEFRLLVRGEDDDLPGEVKINLYRIAQEALSNVIKHSGASRAVVYFGRDGGGIDLMISDNGRGFAHLAEGGKSGGGVAGEGGKEREGGTDDGRIHLGLVSMRERAEQLGGTFQVFTGESGVTVGVHIPVERDVGA